VSHAARQKSKMNKRIGIFGGSFDPVHKGHIAFALQALQDVRLDAVYFSPETKPRRKEGVTHITHRIAMLELALRPYPKLKVLELPDTRFSVAKTLPRLQQRFGNSELLFLMGADSELDYLLQWPLVKRLLLASGLIIAERGRTKQAIEETVGALPASPRSVYILYTKTSDISSAQIRAAISTNKTQTGLLPSIQKYIAQNWLYKTIP
jgi:nicotinate-nucleotide adenylyltransferase